MKILVVAPDVDMGMIRGDAIHLRNVVSHWAREHEIHLIAATGRSDCPDSVSRLVNSTPKTSFLPDYVEPWMRALPATLSLQHKYDYDLVYERHHLFGSGLLGSVFDDTQTVLEVNGSLVTEHEIRDSISAATAKVLRAVERSIVRLADKVICVSPKLADELRRRGVSETKPAVVSNGCDTETFRPRENAKAELGWDESWNHVGFVGGLFDWHGVEQIVDSLAHVLEVEPRTKLVIVGDGPLRDELEQQASDSGVEANVEFVGQVPHHRVPVFMSAFDVGTILKHPDIPGSPLKLYEYLACGTPVVATDDADFDVVARNRVGATARYDDSREVAEAILRVLDADDADISRQARSVARDHSWEKVAQRALDASSR
jgi:glycosyltransferase involved in cell wall biosynthesis